MPGRQSTTLTTAFAAAALLALAAWAPMFSEAAEVEVRADVTPRVATPGERIAYTLTVSSNRFGVSAAAVQIVSPPRFGEHLQPRTQTPQSSTQRTLINGVRTNTLQLTWSALAARPGVARISEARVRFRGKLYDLPAFQIQVAKSADGALPVAMREGKVLQAQTSDANVNKQLQGKLFARIEFSKTNPYLQEPIEAKCILYLGTLDPGQILNPRWKPPGWKGFFATEHDVGRLTLRDVLVEGRRYKAVTIGGFTLTPTQAGAIEIPVHNAECALRVQSRRRSIFDDPFFGFGGQNLPVRLPLTAATLHVKPLPADGQPASFQGAVGKFTFAASVDRREMTTDDFLTLRCQIAGQGFLGSVAEPLLPELRNWEPTGKPEIQIDAPGQGQTLGGRKTFAFLLKPQQPGTLVVPAVRYAFFDPAKARYVEQVSQAFEIQVEPGEERELFFASEATPGSLARRPRGDVAEKIAYIRTAVPAASVAAPFYSRGFFVPLQLAPLAALLAAAFYRSWRGYAERHRDRIEFRGAGARARRELKEAAACLKSGDADAFYVRLAEALRHYLGTKLGRSATGLTLDEIDRECAERGVAQQAADEMRALLERCDRAHYLPETGVPEDARKAYERAAGLLGTLDEAFAAK